MVVAIKHDVAFSLTAFGKSCPVCIVTFFISATLEIRRVESRLS